MSKKQAANGKINGGSGGSSIRDRIQSFRRVKASELHPHPLNWRKHPAEQQAAMRGILAEVGYVDALMVRELPGGQLQIIDGHLRAETTPDTEVPVLVVDLDDAEAAKVLATFDPLAAMAESNAENLDALLREFETGDEALGKMLDELAKDAGCEWAKGDEIVEDEVPEPPAVAITKPGDLWLMGEHRLLCGDSTDGNAVDKLFAGGCACLLFTSPPYAQQRDYTKKIDDWDGLMQGVFQHASRIMEPDGQVLVNLGLIHRDGEWVPYWESWILWMREQGWRRFGWYVWDQGPGMPGDWSGRLAPSHEFIFHFNQSAAKPDKARDCKYAGQRHGGKGQRGTNGEVKARSHGHAPVQPKAIFDSVIRVNRQGAKAGAGDHPAPFPVGLAATFLQSWPGLTYEPFSGSGTTIIAAEQLNRRCYAIELEPRYCDVAVTRWENLTGRKATLAT